MFGGFMGCGNAHKFIDALAKSGVKNLTMICNDGGMLGGPMGEDFYGVAKLIHNKQVSKMIATHVGLNPEVGIQSFDGTLETILVPQGSFVEMIRAKGAGLGGVLTPTGIGTDIAEGKQVINVDGKDYLLETALKGDVCLIKGSIVDKLGNVYYKGTTKNFCPLMAAACKTVIVEAEKLVEPGEIAPEDVMTPFVLVDYIVVGGNN